ncbi:MAG TPA: glycosyltransferase family 9 protein, partial [Segetibacter sp.]
LKKTTIRELITLIYHSKLFIGLDSGPSHISASLGVPSIIFFGAVNPVFRHFSELFNGVFMQEKCEFNGCYHEVILDTKGPACKLVGDEGIPKCSVHSTMDVIANAQKLLAAQTADINEK